MNTYLLEIIVFKKNFEKNNVVFNKGLNIVTGNSKTGKSALLEIVDYCLLNSQNCIPKGIIANECILFAIVLKAKNKKIIIARQPYTEEFNGRRYVFVSIEKKDFNEKILTYNYFIKKNYLYRSISEATSLILNEFGVKVEKRIYYEGDTKRKKISLRNIASYIFQQQNLIANKYALFYRFEDSLKRKSAIEEFPIFTGMIDQKYYELTSELEELRKKIIRKEKKEIIYKQEKKQLIEKQNILQEDLEKIKGDISWEEIQEEKIATKIDEIENNIENLQKKIIQNNLRINNFKRSLNNFDDIGKEIDRASKVNFNDKNQCPLCKSELQELNQKISLLIKNKENLINLFVKKTKEESSIYIKMNKLKIETDKFITERKELEIFRDKMLTDIFSDETKTIRRLIIDKKIEIDLIKERIQLLENDFKKNDLTCEEIRIRDIENAINQYKLVEKLCKAENQIAEEMSRIAEKFDFELALGKPNFKIDLKEFDVYQKFNKEKISISSMGSGSNWLTVHLSLFLALNYYFCTLGNKCSIPPILFIDQPSQVYFPDKINEESEDFKKVEKIYKTILEEINYTKKRTGITPQVIIVDHADKLNLGENIEFELFIRARWKKDGEGFIKN